MTETPERPTGAPAGHADNAGDTVSRAVDAAIANAALEGIEILDDERALIEAHQRGELTHDEFLEAARQIAQRKGGGGDG